MIQIELKLYPFGNPMGAKLISVIQLINTGDMPDKRGLHSYRCRIKTEGQPLVTSKKFKHDRNKDVVQLLKTALAGRNW
jgi:hypothetical protein